MRASTLLLAPRRPPFLDFDPSTPPPHSLEVVAGILRTRCGEVLAVSEDGLKVGRLVPMEVMESEELVGLRTVEAVNLPRDSSIDSVRTKFAVVGPVVTVRMEHTPRGATAVVEYESHEVAFSACEALTDTNNWRGGLRVSLAGGVTIAAARKQLKKLTKKTPPNTSTASAAGVTATTATAATTGAAAAAGAAATTPGADAANGNGAAAVVVEGGVEGGSAAGVGGGGGAVDGAAAAEAGVPTGRLHGRIQKVNEG